MFGVGNVRCNRHIIMRYFSNGIVIKYYCAKIACAEVGIIEWFEKLKIILRTTVTMQLRITWTLFDINNSDFPERSE